MEMKLSSEPIYKPVISRADIPTIRYFRMPGAALSEKPCEFTPKGAVWTVSTQKNAPAFSAVGYTFGERLAKDIDVPIGLIYTALGASCMQTWMPEEDLVKIPALSLILKKFNEEKKGYTKDTYKKKLAEYEAAYAKHKKDVEEAKKNKKAEITNFIFSTKFLSFHYLRNTFSLLVKVNFIIGTKKYEIDFHQSHILITVIIYLIPFS